MEHLIRSALKEANLVFIALYDSNIFKSYSILETYQETVLRYLNWLAACRVEEPVIIYLTNILNVISDMLFHKI